MKHILKPAMSLLIIAAITTALLAYVHSLTLEPISNQMKKSRENTMKVILPDASQFIEINTETQGNIDSIYEARNEKKELGLILELSVDGYSGKIFMMIGFLKEEKEIAGLRIIKHSETPGLGALAVKEKFYRQFDNIKMVPLGLVRSAAGENEIQAISGSTITSRAITSAVNEAIEWYADYTKNSGAGLP